MTVRSKPRDRGWSFSSAMRPSTENHPRRPADFGLADFGLALGTVAQGSASASAAEDRGPRCVRNRSEKGRDGETATGP